MFSTLLEYFNDIWIFVDICKRPGLGTASPSTPGTGRSVGIQTSSSDGLNHV